MLRDYTGTIQLCWEASEERQIIFHGEMMGGDALEPFETQNKDDLDSQSAGAIHIPLESVIGVEAKPVLATCVTPKRPRAV